jgi:hypothetical protein
MSMTVHYKHVSPRLLALFEREPGLVEPFTIITETYDQGAPEAAAIKEHMSAEERELLKEIANDMREQIKEISPKNAEKIFAEAKSPGLSLYKYFENVQFHISGEITDHGTSLISQAVTGGENIGNDGPYGPAAFLSPEEVRDVAAMLSEISEEDFLTKYSANEWDEQTTRFALDYFKVFVAYYADAAKASHAMLVWGA